MLRILAVIGAVAITAVNASAAQNTGTDPDDGVILRTGGFKNPVVRQDFIRGVILDPDSFFAEFRILPEGGKSLAAGPFVLLAAATEGTGPLLPDPWAVGSSPVVQSAAYTFDLASGHDDRTGMVGERETSAWQLSRDLDSNTGENQPLVLQVELEESVSGLDFGFTYAEVVTAAIFTMLGLAVLAVGWGFVAAKLDL